MVKVKVKNENKKERFVRIAESRTQRLLNDIRLLGNCSNTSAYEYNEENISKIFKAIDEELRRIKTLFSKTKHNKSFSLS